MIRNILKRIVVLSYILLGFIIFAEKISIGEIPNTVFIEKNGYTYEITGNGKMDKIKFWDSTKSIKENSSYTI